MENKPKRTRKKYAAELEHVQLANQTIQQQILNSLAFSAYQRMEQGDTEKVKDLLTNQLSTKDPSSDHPIFLRPLQRVGYGAIPSRIATEGLKVNALAINSVGELAIAGSSELHSAVIWDLNQKQVLNRLPAQTASVRAATWSADNQFLFTGHQDGQVNEWKTPKLERTKTYQTNPEAGFELIKLRITSDACKLVALTQKVTEGVVLPEGRVHIWDRTKESPQSR